MSDKYKSEDEEFQRVLEAMNRREPTIGMPAAGSEEWRQQPPLWKSGPSDTYETEPGLESPVIDPLDLVTGLVSGPVATKAAVSAANARPNSVSLPKEQPEQKHRLAALRDLSSPESTVPSMFDAELKGQIERPDPISKRTAFEDPTPVRPVDLKRTEPYSPAELKAAEILKQEESFTPNAFVDETRPRVGYSTEEYEDGKPVKMGDSVSEEKAYDMMMSRVGRDQKTVEKFKTRAPLLKDPKVEAVTLSRMYHQGPGNVLPVNKDADKNRRLKLYKALKSGKKSSFAEAVKNAEPGFSKRLRRESAILADKLIRGISGRRK